MALKNRSMYAILGILSLSPSTGYDIKKYSDSVLASFWNENFGHIYPTLKTMLGEGMIEIVDRAASTKKIRYGITEKGRREFGVWLAEDTEQQPIRSEFLLKLLFSSSQPRESVVATLQAHRARHTAQIAAYQGMQSKLAQGIPEVSRERSVFLNAVLRRGILSSEAVVQWCDETIAELGQGEA